MTRIDHLLAHSAPLILAVIVQPQPPRQHDGKRRKAHGSGQGNEVREDGDGLGEDEGEGAEADGAGEPGAPVDERVSLEMRGVAQDADEDVFRGDVEVEAAADHEADEADAVGSGGC